MGRPVVTCPNCKRTLSSDEDGVWPFCSERCRLLDLGAWAAEKYRISTNNSNPADQPDDDES